MIPLTGDSRAAAATCGEEGVGGPQRALGRFWGEDTAAVFTGAVVTQLYAFVKCHGTVS